MKLFTFGDSWTEGVGSDLAEESMFNTIPEKTKIRHKYCWPKLLADLLKCDLQNDGAGGVCNDLIFESVCSRLKNEIIKKNDFVIIMWSSSLRNNLPFFPKENNLNLWAKRYKTKMFLYQYLFQKDSESNYEYNRLDKDFKDFYIRELFTDTYYDIINQNYILYLQFILKGMGIRYLFCDAFDNMISSDILTDIDKTNYIDKNRYWGFKNKTFANFLIDTNRKDVWEDNEYWKDTTVGKHPNKNGYKLISDELYNFIIKNQLLDNNSYNKSYII